VTELHGGELAFESNENGSVFRLFLPLKNM